MAGLGGVAHEAGSKIAVPGRDVVQMLVEIVEGEAAAAAGLLEKLNFEAVAFGLYEDRQAGARGGNADAAEVEPAIAVAGAQAGTHPTWRGAAARVRSGDSRRRDGRRWREAGAAVAEAFVELVAQAAGPRTRRPRCGNRPNG